MTLAAKPKQPRPKKCRVCTETYTPSKPLQVVCSPSCALLHAAQKRERERKALDQIERKAIREAKEKNKPRSAYMKRLRPPSTHGCVSVTPTSRASAVAGIIKGSGTRGTTARSPAARNCALSR